MQKTLFEFFFIVIVFCTAVCCCLPVQSSGALSLDGKEADHVDGRTIYITDERDNLITVTAREVYKGDEIIMSTGDHYRVARVKGDTAGAERLGQDEDYLAWVDYFQNSDTIAVSAINWSERPVGVYHTHTDESYVPTDGKSSIPFHGGIYQVGERFAEVLHDNKIDVKYYKTPHDPHDENAYTRSRRTAMGLLKNNPIALFDIHRDGVPNPEYYSENIGGEKIAQLVLVVGRQNPKMKANMDFARRIMAYANKEHPGLVKQIHVANGNYNQDLISTAILVEAGTYTNVKQNAEVGISFLAESLPVVLGVDNPGGGVTSDEAGKTGWSVALGLVLITLAGGLAFAVINFGWQGTLDRIKGIWQGLLAGELRLRAARAGRKGTEYIQGPVAAGIRAAGDKVKKVVRKGIGRRSRV